MKIANDLIVGRAAFLSRDESVIIPGKRVLFSKNYIQITHDVIENKYIRCCKTGDGGKKKKISRKSRVQISMNEK